MKKQRKRTGRQILLRLLFLIYVAAMFWLLFGQRWGTQIYAQNLASPINLTPFATVKMYLRILQNSRDTSLLIHAFVNLVGNVVMFIPLGFFVPYLNEGLRKFLKAMFFVACLIITVETIQYFTYLGSCDVDDLILNMAGGTVGYIFWRVKRQ